MTEQPEPEPAAEQQPAEEFQPITSQEELNKRIGERIAGVKKKYADYDELKSKATEFDKLQEASKTELEKWQERYNKLAKDHLYQSRKAYAAEKGIPVAALTGDTPEEWAVAAEEILAWRAEQEKPPAKPKTSSSNLKSGATGTDTRMDPQERAAAALRAMRQQ